MTNDQVSFGLRKTMIRLLQQCFGGIGKQVQVPRKKVIVQAYYYTMHNSIFYVLYKNIKIFDFCHYKKRVSIRISYNNCFILRIFVEFFFQMQVTTANFIHMGCAYRTEQLVPLLDSIYLIWISIFIST